MGFPPSPRSDSSLKVYIYLNHDPTKCAAAKHHGRLRNDVGLHTLLTDRWRRGQETRTIFPMHVSGYRVTERRRSRLNLVQRCLESLIFQSEKYLNLEKNQKKREQAEGKGSGEPRRFCETIGADILGMCKKSHKKNTTPT